jgi:hypothetical protein
MNAWHEYVFSWSARRTTITIKRSPTLVRLQQNNLHGFIAPWDLEAIARGSQATMVRCSLCNDLEKKDVDHVRHAFDFAPEEIKKTTNLKCQMCSVILEGILQFVEGGSSFEEDVTRVYTYCLGIEDDSLCLELYFKDDRPKLILEFFYPENPDKRGESRLYILVIVE